MRKMKIWLVAGLVMTAGAPAASAEGLYVGGNIGFSGGGGEVDNSGLDLNLDTGIVLSGVVGKAFGNARLEAEIAYRQNDMDNVDLVGPIAGEMSSFAVMGNVYYDFGDTTWSFRPYVGIGIGAAGVTLTSPDYGFTGTDDTDTTLALQIMLGGSIPLSGGMAMTVDLRSMGAVPEFVANDGTPFEQDYGVASLMVGVRQSF